MRRDGIPDRDGLPRPRADRRRPGRRPAAARARRRRSTCSAMRAVRRRGPRPRPTRSCRRARTAVEDCGVRHVSCSSTSGEFVDAGRAARARRPRGGRTCPAGDAGRALDDPTCSAPRAASRSTCRSAPGRPSPATRPRLATLRRAGARRAGRWPEEELAHGLLVQEMVEGLYASAARRRSSRRGSAEPPGLTGSPGRSI